MDTVTENTTDRPAQWAPKPGEAAQILAALKTEAYPPRSRWGVGTVVRRAA
jgi:hypothetical protein